MWHQGTMGTCYVQVVAVMVSAFVVCCVQSASLLQDETSARAYEKFGCNHPVDVLAKPGIDNQEKTTNIMSFKRKPSVDHSAVKSILEPVGHRSGEVNTTRGRRSGQEFEMQPPYVYETEETQSSSEMPSREPFEMEPDIQVRPSKEEFEYVPYVYEGDKATETTWVEPFGEEPDIKASVYEPDSSLDEGAFQIEPSTIDAEETEINLAMPSDEEVLKLNPSVYKKGGTGSNRRRLSEERLQRFSSAYKAAQLKDIHDRSNGDSKRTVIKSSAGARSNVNIPSGDSDSSRDMQYGYTHSIVNRPRSKTQGIINRETAVETAAREQKSSEEVQTSKNKRLSSGEAQATRHRPSEEAQATRHRPSGKAQTTRNRPSELVDMRNRQYGETQRTKTSPHGYSESSKATHVVREPPQHAKVDMSTENTRKWVKPNGEDFKTGYIEHKPEETKRVMDLSPEHGAALGTENAIAGPHISDVPRTRHHLQADEGNVASDLAALHRIATKFREFGHFVDKPTDRGGVKSRETLRNVYKTSGDAFQDDHIGTKPAEMMNSEGTADGEEFINVRPVASKETVKSGDALPGDDGVDYLPGHLKEVESKYPFRPFGVEHSDGDTKGAVNVTRRILQGDDPEHLSFEKEEDKSTGSSQDHPSGDVHEVEHIAYKKEKTTSLNDSPSRELFESELFEYKTEKTKTLRNKTPEKVVAAAPVTYRREDVKFPEQEADMDPFEYSRDETQINVDRPFGERFAKEDFVTKKPVTKHLGDPTSRRAFKVDEHDAGSTKAPNATGERLAETRPTTLIKTEETKYGGKRSPEVTFKVKPIILLAPQESKVNEHLIYGEPFELISFEFNKEGTRFNDELKSGEHFEFTPNSFTKRVNGETLCREPFEAKPIPVIVPCQELFEE